MNNVKVTACYCRVSTVLNQDLNNQLEPIKQFASARDYELQEEFIYKDKISGGSSRRPGLDKLLEDARLGKFKYLIIFSVDRLGRNLAHLIRTVNTLVLDYNIKPIFLRENIDFDSSTGRLLFGLLASISEFERSLISERVKVSLATKKALAEKTGNGWTTGRRPTPPHIKDKVMSLRKEGLSIRAISDELDSVSKSTIQRILKEQEKLSQKGL